MEINNSILVIGPSNSGKTTFQAQLYARIQADLGRVKLAKMPKNLSGIENAIDRLADGLETETTPATENLEVVIPVTLNGSEFNLVCKDYGGEQVRDITQLMEFDPTWAKRAKEHDRWLLFIRPSEVYHHYDLSISGYAEVDEKKQPSAEEEADLPENKLSDQYHFIELLQSLIYARGVGMKSMLSSPKLMIVLTCWDELNTSKEPKVVLKEKLPLLHNFIETVWEKDSRRVIGLSAQEFPLNTPEAKEKYQVEMPESFGYLVLEDNPKEKDLTRLIEVALDL